MNRACGRIDSTLNSFSSSIFFNAFSARKRFAFVAGEPVSTSLENALIRRRDHHRDFHGKARSAVTLPIFTNSHDVTTDPLVSKIGTERIFRSKLQSAAGLTRSCRRRRASRSKTRPAASDRSRGPREVLSGATDAHEGPHPGRGDPTGQLASKRSCGSDARRQPASGHGDRLASRFELFALTFAAATYKRARR